jgi:multiple sugar transport system substrate-binding protein
MNQAVLDATLRAPAALLVAVMLLVACNQAAAPTSSPAAAPTTVQATAGTATAAAPTTATATAAGEVVELTLLDHQELRVNALRELVPKFESEMAAQGRNIKVRLLEGPASDAEFETKITLDYSTGNAADVISSGAGPVPNYVAAGYLLDLTDMVNAWDEYQHVYQVLRDEMVQADGRIYSVPREATVMQLFYRKDVLEENGVSTEQPQSWADLQFRMEELKAKLGKHPILIPAGESWGGGTFWEGFVHLILGTDSQLYDESDGKWVVRSPGLTSVFNYYESLTEADLLPVRALLNPEPWVPTKYEAFPRGELAVTTCGTWCWIFDWGPGARGEIPDIHDKVATWEFPTEQGDGTFIWGASGWLWTISATTAHPEEAFELVKWLASGEALASHLVAIGAAAPMDNIQDVAPYADMPYLIDAEKSLERGRSFQARVGLDKIAQAVGEATEEIVSRRLTGEEAADMFAEQVTRLMGADNVKEMP